jgi:hypothetical protein
MEMKNEKKGYMQEMETKRKSRPMESGLLVQRKSDMQSSMRVWTTPIHEGIWESERNARGQSPRQKGEIVEKNQSSEESCRVKARGGEDIFLCRHNAMRCRGDRGSLDGGRKP